MSHVFVATEIALGREVVVKVLPGEMAGQVSVDRFKREIALAARLQHPHIVPLLTAGDAEGLPYFTMPFVSGESLRARLVKQGELPLSEAVRLLREIASALAYAHDRGIVHRDIKPENVLLSGGSAMITDFGVAKALSASTNGDAGSMTSIGVALGTPAYMSPEQASADPAVDHRADIYAVGVLAYELLTGQPPFVGRTPASLLAAHVTEAPDHITKRRTTIPPALATLVMRCLEKRTADRPQTAAEVVHALDAITTPDGGSPRTAAQFPDQKTAAPSEPLRSRSVIRLAIGLVVVAGLTFGITRFMQQSGSARRIAVLPFDIGADTAHAYLADGLSAELTTKLAKIPGLTVRPYESSKFLRGKRPREAGTILDVGAVLTATVRRADGQLRVNATLVNIADDAVLWSETFDESDQNQFALQDKLASAIASALRLSLAPATQTAARTGHVPTPELHDRVQRARFLTDAFGETNLRSAVAILTEVTEKDPQYADAWAALASAWMRLADDFEAPVTALPPMRAAVARALTLDPDLADAHAQRGTQLVWYEWRYDEAEKEFLTALRMDSTNATALAMYPVVLSARLRDDSARAVAFRSIRTNPTSNTSLTRFYQRNRDAFAYISADSGAAICQRLTQIGNADGAWRCNAYRLLALGKGDSARLVARNAPKNLTSANNWIRWAWLSARIGDTTAARSALARAFTVEPGRYLREDFIASTYCLLNDKEESLRWWARGRASRSAGISFAWVECPNLRSDPRFRAAIGEENVPK
jgi:serine/threonine-protein kinase